MLPYSVIYFVEFSSLLIYFLDIDFTRPRSAVRNVSGFKYSSDCRSRGREFDPALSHNLVEIDYEIISTVILLSSAESFKKGLFKLAKEKVWLGELTIPP